MSVTFPLAGGRILTTERPAFIMSILNVTDDSFWDGSRVSGADEAVERALEMVASGADIIDIGGESTRPGARYISAEEELSRIIPVITLLRKRSDIPVSVDTRKASVLRAALDAGADILNDVSAMEDDPEVTFLVARSGIPVILMHKKGSPDTMQHNPVYRDVVSEVRDYLFSRAQAAQDAGIDRRKIILDPGIGFGKEYEHNMALITGLAEIAAGGYPVLMALSRKRVIGHITGRDIPDRLAGTLAANMVAVRNGATFLRVHDTAETADMLAVVQETNKKWNS